MKACEAFIKELENIETSIAEKEAPVSKVKTIEDMKKESPNKKLDRFKLQEALLEQAREKKLKAMNPYELLREKIMAFFHETFKEHLGDLPSSWPLYEIFYYDDLKTLRNMLVGAPRNAIQVALNSPYQYLKVF